MANKLRQWRKANGLTQVEAAELLAVSQPYLSLIEKGERPLTAVLRARMELPGKRDVAAVSQDIHEDLVALGYPGFAFNKPTRRRPSPTDTLYRALRERDLEPRVAEGLPWVTRRYAGEVDWPWLVHQAKMLNRQNRLGFVMDLGESLRPEPLADAARQAKAELDRSLLKAEDTFFWDSMTGSMRDWFRENRTPTAARWNVLSRVRVEDLRRADT